MASNYHQCHCHSHPTAPTPTVSTHNYHQPTPPTPTTTTCNCTTTHYPSPPPPSDHLISYHHHHHHQQPSQNHNNYHPPHQIQQKHQLYHQHENVEASPLNPTVSSLIHRISALESTLCRRSNQSPRSSYLRDAAARTIQTHFRAFLVQRSVTLRHLKDLAYIKSALSHLKSSVSNKTHFDSYFISRESMNLLIRLDSIQGSDPMIRDGKRSITRELIRFMDLVDQISKESQLISVKNVRLSKIRASGSRVLGDNERKLAENLKKRINKLGEESFEIENPAVSVNRNGGLTKIQPKVKKTVSFDENGNIYRIFKSNHSFVLSDDEEVEEIGVSSKETQVVEEEDSSEIEMDPRKNLGTQKNQPVDENEDEDEDEDDSFVFSAPLPAKMEYRVDSVNKKQTTKH